MNLTELKFGQKAIIEKVTDDDLSLKLFEMGLLPGESILLENVAPFGDPIAVLLSESKICIRLQDAASVQIKLIS
ncbi:MAG: FeoA family protein [Bacteroidetes bacterium]|nr:FeoA family protein [Bacteroidota bacterium]